ncbi:MAG TPA: ABC transporter ATP-binding protein [Actinoplanes sp.]|nr:ABC transporter ATP-binding protein [Actinoplanes sp.]
MPTTSVLHGRNLILRYGRTTVVDGVSAALEPGRVTALVGPNGSGKSTLLRALARLHPVHDGEVALSGGDGPERPAARLSARDFAREVTLFTQSRQAPPGLTVREVVAFGRHPHRRRFAGPGPDDQAAVDRAMRLTGVQDKADRPGGELSGGEMQRVWLAASLAQETGVVLLDEPTNHLDLRYQIETLDLVRDLADDHGAAVGIVLHDLDHAARIADTLLLLSAGRIHAAGDPLEVLTAENLSAVYGLRVEVGTDPLTGRLRIDPVGRHPVRYRTTVPGENPA